MLSFRRHLLLPFFLCGLMFMQGCGSGSADDTGADAGAAGGSVGQTQSVTIRLIQVPLVTPAADVIYVAGSFNGWNPADPKFKLAKAADGSFQAKFNFAESGKLYEFKFTRGSWATGEKTAAGAERANRTFTVADGAIIDGVVENWADFVSQTVAHTAAANVTILRDFDMPQLTRKRNVWVYLPADYAQSGKLYPVLYMHDAQNLFDSATSFLGEWGVDETLNKLAQDGAYPGMIVVGVESDGATRYEEYSPWPLKDINGQTRGGDGDKYVRFLIDTLKPYIDSHYRTVPDAKHTAIAGSSMGGLISLYAGLKYPNVFGHVGAISPYISEIRIGSAVVDFVKAAKKQAGSKVYLDIGAKEVVRNENQELIDAVAKVKAALIGIGFDSTSLNYQLVPDGQHGEAAWSARFAAIAQWLLPPDLVEDSVLIDLDTDKDGLPDDFENSYAFLNKIDANDAALDFDKDTLSNLLEYTFGTKLDKSDTDADSLPDGFEVMHKLNPLLASDAQLDTDKDNLSNAQEYGVGTDIGKADSDGDAIPDGFEVSHKLNPLSAVDAKADLDLDGLSNLEEFNAGTDISVADTDADGMPDGFEAAHRLNPLSAIDAALDLDGDGITNIAEYNGKTLVELADTDGDGVSDGQDFYPLDKTRSAEVKTPELVIRVFKLPANTPANASIYVAGTFNAWSPADPAYQLKRDEEGVLSVSIKAVTVGATVKFKFTRGGWANVEKDRTVQDVTDHEVVIANGQKIAAYAIANWADVGQKQTHSVLGDVRIINDFAIPQLNRRRTVRVYLPPNYAGVQMAYPVLYMYDGQNVFDVATTAFGTEWQVDETLDRLYYERKIAGLIVVAVDNASDRGCEYNVFADDPHPFCSSSDNALGDKFNQFVVETLKPYIDKTYRTKADRDHTFVAGSSMGGQMSMKMGLTYSAVFSKLAALSPSYQNTLAAPLKMPAYIKSTNKPVALDIYQDMGEAEQIRDITATTLVKNLKAVDQALLDVGFDRTKVTTKVVPGAVHNEGAWSARFADIAMWLMR